MNRTHCLFATGLACLAWLTARVQAQVQPGEAFFQSAAAFAPRGGVALPMIPAEVGKPYEKE